MFLAADDGCSSPNGCDAEDDEANELKASLLQRTKVKAHSSDAEASLLARKEEILAELARIEEALVNAEADEESNDNELEPKKDENGEYNFDFLIQATTVTQKETEEIMAIEGKNADTVLENSLDGAVARKDLNSFGTNNCASAQDQQKWAGGATFGQEVGDCARSNLNMFSGTRGCMQKNGYSKGCASCMAAYTGCNQDKCLMPCNIAVDQAKCNQCAVANCNPGFNSCSGLALR